MRLAPLTTLTLLFSFNLAGLENLGKCCADAGADAESLTGLEAFSTLTPANLNTDLAKLGVLRLLSLALVLVFLTLFACVAVEVGEVGVTGELCVASLGN